jgi:hypothetical protein
LKSTTTRGPSCDESGADHLKGRRRCGLIATCAAPNAAPSARIESLVRWWLIVLVVWIAWVPVAVALFFGVDRVARWINHRTLPPTQNPRILDPRTSNRNPFQPRE